MPNWPGLAQQFHLALELGASASQLLTSPQHTALIIRCYLSQLAVQEWPVSRHMANLEFNIFIVLHESRPTSEQQPILTLLPYCSLGP